MLNGGRTGSASMGTDCKVGAKMKILVSGSTGLIGRQVVAARRALGDEVVPLVRSAGTVGAVQWDPAREVDPAAVSGFDAVIHLAGEPLANGRWTKEKKRRIRDSRLDGARGLATALAAARHPPEVFVCASGINFYGSTGAAVVDERTPAGQGFLAEICVEGESAAARLGSVSRVVSLRIGAVLTPEGGTLAAMLPLFRMGVAGPIAGGGNWVSWVTLSDVISAIGHVLHSDHLRGPVNVVSPEPVTGREFTSAIAEAVRKPAIIPVPAWAARLMLGEMAEETVLTSIRAVPRRLLEDGFVFQYPNLSRALAGWQLTGK